MNFLIDNRTNNQTIKENKSKPLTQWPVSYPQSTTEQPKQDAKQAQSQQ